MTDDTAPINAEKPGAATPRDTGEGLCSSFVELLSVTGVSISVIGGSGQSTIGASDQVAARMEELQFELGEGPHWTALRTGQPVLVPDLHEAAHSQWPVFGAAALELGIGALFAFPLIMGAVTIGVVDLYRSSPGTMDSGTVSRALSLTALTAGPALRLAGRSAGQDAPTNGMMVPEMRREVHQATGMVLAQLEMSATEAFSRLQAHAFSRGRTVQYVAHEVVMRRLNFRDLTE
ncbi:MAG TPA: GAF and ANTAR domain-containing protein [Microbacteriaceae bacterium]